MSFNNFLKGALDRVPDGLQFGQAVHQGRFANEKMGMEREQFDMAKQQFANQQELHNLQYGVMQEENEKIDPLVLAQQMSQIGPVQEKIVEFLSPFRGTDGLVRRKQLAQAYDYINKPEVVEQLYPAVKATYEQKIADLRAQLANPKKSASGGYAVDPALIQKELKDTQTKLEHLNLLSRAWLVGKEVEFKDRDLKIKEREAAANIALDRAHAAYFRDKGTGGGGLDSSIINNIADNAEALAKSSWQERLRKSGAVSKDSSGNPYLDEDGKPILKYVVYDVVNKGGKPVRVNRFATEDEERQRKEENRRDAYNQVIKSTAVTMGVPEQALYSQMPDDVRKNATGYLKPGQGITIDNGKKDDKGGKKPDVQPRNPFAGLKSDSGFGLANPNSEFVAIGRGVKKVASNANDYFLKQQAEQAYRQKLTYAVQYNGLDPEQANRMMIKKLEDLDLLYGE